MIKEILVIFLVIGIALVLNDFDIRFCPFFNLFNIPCVGCGMTRAVKLIMKGEIIDGKTIALAFKVQEYKKRHEK